MTDSMVERVARALCTSHYRDRFGKPSTDPHVQSNVDGNWHLFAEDAMTAIEAMGGYTEVMARAGCRAIQDFEEDDPNGMLMDFRWRSCWKAMISAALAQPTGEKT